MFQFLRLAIFTFTSSLPRWLSGKESACQSRRCRRHSLDPWVGKTPWRRKWQPTTVFLLGKSHGQRGMVGYSPWGHKESDTTEHAHTSLLHVMFPLPKMLEYLYTHAHTHKHTHTSFPRLAHLSGASSSRKTSMLCLCLLQLCRLLLLCNTRTLWTSHFNVIAIHSVKCLTQNEVN